MQSNTGRYLITIVILIAALAVLVGIFGRDMLQSRLLPHDQGYTYITDIDRWRKTRRERIVQSYYDFSLGPQLHQIPYNVGTWTGRDVPQDNIEVQILLEPEQYIRRLYQNGKGDNVWLSIIGSRDLKSFHPPQICYDADGWHTEIKSEEIPLEEGSIYAMHVEARKDNLSQTILYFFLYPDYLRDPARGIVLFKVTASSSHNGALEMEKEFIRQFFFSAQDSPESTP
ncbi:MAG: exosortase-associated EpsI family protein [Gammaproteobacteria bacterium]|nr:exosortase-associated EpsI family protein [Gammaproteobacteria bacterium]